VEQCPNFRFSSPAALTFIYRPIITRSESSSILPYLIHNFPLPEALPSHYLDLQYSCYNSQTTASTSIETNTDMRFLPAFTALVAATNVASLPLPLNINLGAFSPALVVGDGEISFGGGEASVESLMSTLQGASTTDEAGATPVVGEGENQRAQLDNADGKTPAVITPAETTTLQTGQGIGSDIEPREPEPENTDTTVEKRDFAGFNAALNFASDALKTSPGVQLGTGEGGSGIGIIVQPGVNNPEGTVIGKRAEENC
jgi:hypothetical protein